MARMPRMELKLQSTQFQIKYALSSLIQHLHNLVIMVNCVFDSTLIADCIL